MIYTVTFNPALDYIVSVEDFKLGLTNRTTEERMLPGGKGINVSIVLRNLGIESCALGFVAGFTGQEIVRLVESCEITPDFIQLDEGVSRINLKLSSIDGTEINGMGPKIAENKVELLMTELRKLAEGDVLCLSGSIPRSLPNNIYRRIMGDLQDRGVMVVVDATGELLVNVLEYRPFLIKPNNHELEEIFGEKLHKREDILPYAVRLREMGARNVLVSMAEKGAILLTEDGQVLDSRAPAGQLISSVGCGDAMIAGFLAGYLEKGDITYAFHMGLAAGSAKAFSPQYPSKEDIEELYKTLED